MNKELEILEDISKEECLFKNRNTIYMGDEKVNSFTHKDTIGNYFKGIEDIKQALQRLESIDNAKPNEALEELGWLYANARIESGWVKERCITYKEEFEHNDRIKPYYDTIKQALLKAQQSEKANARNEEILQKFYQEGITLDSVRALKQERDNYKKALSIIKEKDVDIYILQSCKTVDEYNSKIVHITGETRELTKEEFDTLKE